jgi:UDP-N-acetylmuramate: L-alanyl-gamma-D-glutamyl-meso-diaminopimelate ligase
VALHALARFEGVARRQDLLGSPRGVRIYDDFAHHPTAVRHTLAGLRKRHRQGRLVAVYEARTATACRKLHQQAYLEAFDAVDRVIFAPLGRDNIVEGERLDLDRLVNDLRARGIDAERAASIDAIVNDLVAELRPGDTVALLSNGAFGRIQDKLLQAIEASM